MVVEYFCTSEFICHPISHVWNMQLPLHNGSNNCFCLCALYYYSNVLLFLHCPTPTAVCVGLHVNQEENVVHKSRPQSIGITFGKYVFKEHEMECSFSYWDALLFKKNVDKAWQLLESMFMAIKEQCIPKGVLSRKEVFLE